MEETFDSHKFVALKYWKNFFPFIALISTILTNFNYILLFGTIFWFISFQSFKMTKKLIKRSWKISEIEISVRIAIDIKFKIKIRN